MVKGFRKNGDKKLCVVCNIVKELSDFWKNKSRYDGLQGMCKSCALVNNNEWKKNNKSKVSEIRIRHYKKNKEYINKKEKEYRLKNPEVNRKATKKWRENNLEYAKKLIANWDKNNRDKRNHYRHNREYLKRASGGRGFTYNQWLEIIKETDYCFYCGDFSKKLTRDHFVPLTKGGKHDITNIVPACQECNSRKSDMMPLEFMKKYGFKL